MKLLLINWQDPLNPRAGGAEIHLREVFGRLRARGHSVTWLASGWPGAKSLDEVDGIEIRRTGRRHTFGLAVAPFYRRRLAGRRFDVVIEALNKVPVYAPAWCGCPAVLIVHHLFGTTAFQEATLPMAGLTWLLERPLRRVYGRIPVQAISRSTADDLVRRGLRADRVQVIHPGVDLEFFHPSTSPTRAVVPTFLYLGRLQRYKRIDLILHAFARVRRQGLSCRLVVAGRGDQQRRLQKLARKLGIQESIEFPGFVSETHKRDLYRSAWANVLVSPKEGWGITNLEAAACGTPTIASDSPGLRESVVGGRTGILVPHGDVAALALALRRLASDPDLVEELGAGALGFAGGFSWARTTAATEEHLQAVAGQTGDLPRDPSSTG